MLAIITRNGHIRSHLNKVGQLLVLPNCHLCGLISSDKFNHIKKINSKFQNGSWFYNLKNIFEDNFSLVTLTIVHKTKTQNYNVFKIGSNNFNKF